MKSILMTLAMAMTLTGLTLAHEPPKMPVPQREHKWLEQLEGNWKIDSECSMAPGQPPMKLKGKCTTKMSSGFWLVEDGQMSLGGQTNKSQLMLGYDPRKGKYTGTFTSNCDHTLWVYEGSVDASGKVLTLETEGPNIMKEGKTAKYIETIEIEDAKHRLFTSSIQGDDGKYVRFMTSKYTKTGK